MIYYQKLISHLSLFRSHVLTDDVDVYLIIIYISCGVYSFVLQVRDVYGVSAVCWPCSYLLMPISSSFHSMIEGCRLQKQLLHVVFLKDV